MQTDSAMPPLSAGPRSPGRKNPKKKPQKPRSSDVIDSPRALGSVAGERACQLDLHDFAKALQPFLKQACEEACKNVFSAHLVGLKSLIHRVESLEQYCGEMSNEGTGIGRDQCGVSTDVVGNMHCQVQPDVSSCSTDSTSRGSTLPTTGQDEAFGWEEILYESDMPSSQLTPIDCTLGNHTGADFDFDFDDLEKAELAGTQTLATVMMKSAVSSSSEIRDDHLKNSKFLSEYSLSSGHVIHIRELPLADGVHASTGCQLWPASIALGHFLHRESSLIAGKSIIELGAGCGFAGVVAARYAKQCLITDADEETVTNLRYNLLANRDFWLDGRSDGFSPEVLADTLKWEDVVQNGWAPARRADVVIGSDIVYGNWGALVTNVIQRILVPSGIVIMISATDRGGLSEFRTSMESEGFYVDLSDILFDGKRFLLYKCGPQSLTKKH